MIINLRGTNGSGKSTVARRFLDDYPNRPVFGVLGPRKPEAYAIQLSQRRPHLFLLGAYHTPTGGVDNIQPYDLIPQLIDKYAARGHVLFEGLLTSKLYGQLGACLEKYGKQAIQIFLDTSQEDCIAAVQARRDRRDDHRPFNPKNLISVYDQCCKVRQKILQENKLRVLDVSRDKAYKLIVDLFDV